MRKRSASSRRTFGRSRCCSTTVRRASSARQIARRRRCRRHELSTHVAHDRVGQGARPRRRADRHVGEGSGPLPGEDGHGPVDPGRGRQDLGQARIRRRERIVGRNGEESRRPFRIALAHRGRPPSGEHLAREISRAKDVRRCRPAGTTTSRAVLSQSPGRRARPGLRSMSAAADRVRPSRRSAASGEVGDDDDEVLATRHEHTGRALGRPPDERRVRQIGQQAPSLPPHLGPAIVQRGLEERLVARPRTRRRAPTPEQPGRSRSPATIPPATSPAPRRVPADGARSATRRDRRARRSSTPRPRHPVSSSRRAIATRRSERQPAPALPDRGDEGPARSAVMPGGERQELRKGGRRAPGPAAAVDEQVANSSRSPVARTSNAARLGGRWVEFGRVRVVGRSGRAARTRPGSIRRRDGRSRTGRRVEQGGGGIAAEQSARRRPANDGRWSPERALGQPDRRRGDQLAEAGHGGSGTARSPCHSVSGRNRPRSIRRNTDPVTAGDGGEHPRVRSAGDSSGTAPSSSASRHRRRSIGIPAPRRPLGSHGRARGRRPTPPAWAATSSATVGAPTRPSRRGARADTARNGGRRRDRSAGRPAGVPDRERGVGVVSERPGGVEGEQERPLPGAPAPQPHPTGRHRAVEQVAAGPGPATRRGPAGSASTLAA